MEPMTLAEFARVKGVSATAVKKAIDSGRLVNSIIHGIGKKPKLNPVLAAKEWEQNTAHNKRTIGEDIRPIKQDPAEILFGPKTEEPKEERSQLNVSRGVREAYLARMAKLNYEEKIGKLVDAEEVKAQGFKIGRIIRDTMLNIPDRVAAEFAGITDPAKIHIRLTKEINQCLEVLAQDE